MTINTDQFQAAFVNTAENPIKVDRHGIWKRSDNRYYELVSKYYVHPSAPNDAIVSLLTWEYTYESKNDKTLDGLMDTVEKIMNGVTQIIDIVIKDKYTHLPNEYGMYKQNYEGAKSILDQAIDDSALIGEKVTKEINDLQNKIIVLERKLQKKFESEESKIIQQLKEKIFELSGKVV